MVGHNVSVNTIYSDAHLASQGYLLHSYYQPPIHSRMPFTLRRLAPITVKCHLKGIKVSLVSAPHLLAIANHLMGLKHPHNRPLILPNQQMSGATTHRQADPPPPIQEGLKETSPVLEFLFTDQNGVPTNQAIPHPKRKARALPNQSTKEPRFSRATL